MQTYTVSDIKQYVYCPRIVYFRYVLPVPAKPTEQMKAGKVRHWIENKRENRRTTHRYDLKDGTKTVGCRLFSERLRLTGVLDLLIEADGQLYPVEYKYSHGEPDRHHRCQLTAYALLVEDGFDRVVRSGYVCMLRSQRVFPMNITESRKRLVRRIVSEMDEMIASQTIPEPTPHRWRCSNCEFRLYCADTV